MDWNVQVPTIIGKLSQREVLWFWGQVVTAGAALDPKFIYPKEMAVKHILPFVTGGDSDYNFEIVIADKENCLIPISDFDWIGRNDQRLINWLVHALNSQSFYQPAFLMNPNISKRNRLIATIDLLGMNSSEKSNVLSYFRRDWAAIASQDKIFQWIEKNDDEQCEWIWKRLNAEPIYSLMDFDMLNPVSAEEYYYSFFAKLDRSTLHVAEKEILLGKMKRKWVRLKQSKKKVQANYQLSPKIKLWVEEMADDEGLGKSKFVEKLISDKYAIFKKRGG